MVAVPPGVVTAIKPVVAPAGTVVVIWVAELTVKVAAVPLKVTLVASVKLVPVRVLLVPTGPLVGLKLVRVGGKTTVKLVVLVAVPPGLVTLTVPVVVPVATVAVIWVSEVMLKEAVLPLNRTAVTAVKLLPVITTDVPTRPRFGLKLVMVGGKITVKLVVLMAEPPGVATAIKPVVAPAGTVLVI